MNLLSPLPLLDRFGAPLLIAVFVTLLWVQQRRPLRRQRFPEVRRLIRNLVFSTPGVAAGRLLLVPVPVVVAAWAAHHGIGFIHLLHIPEPWAALLGFLAMDWAYYCWHYATHLVPFLWRFHNVHHSDLDMDVSTASRFHFVEILVSVPFRCAAVLLFGIGPITLLLYEVAFTAAALFHHSNTRLPLTLERWLSRVIITPRMHGVHHSIVQRETNSNWGTIFSFWDRLHRTLRIDIPQDTITIGVPGWRDEKELTLGKLWSMPFGPQREWRLPGGEIPQREPRPTTELEG